ncbi:hypothetical protein JVU11DRAFT_7019 [Chiua virens]|nr:hypothetical protein JVU11DRAFT_7019 [Chiua virens]
MDAEKDTAKAFEGLDMMTTKIFGCCLAQLTLAHTGLCQEGKPSVTASPQLSEAELDLSGAVNELRKRKRITGTPLTLEEMLNPIQEAEVNHEKAVKCGEVVEVESDDEDLDNDGDDETLGLQEMIEMTAKLEKACITHTTLEKAAHVSRCLRQLRVDLRKVESAGLTQPRLDRWFGNSAQ